MTVHVHRWVFDRFLVPDDGQGRRWAWARECERCGRLEVVGDSAPRVVASQQRPISPTDVTWCQVEVRPPEPPPSPPPGPLVVRLGRAIFGLAGRAIDRLRNAKARTAVAAD